MNYKKNKTSIETSKNEFFIQSIIPFFIMMRKTFFFDICTLKKFIISIILMIIVPVITLLSIPAIFLPSTLSGSIVSTILFFYSFGLVFPLLISSSASPLISEELKSGTMLTLVSKPISRTGIIIGKFISLFLFGFLISSISLAILTIIGGLIYPFTDLFQFFTLNLWYSIIIIICFGGLTIGLSSFFKNPRNVSIIPILLIVFSFLVGLIFKMMLMMPSMMGGDNLYEDLLIYNIDISYHMANIYKAFIDSVVPGATDSQGFFYMMFGIFKYELAYSCSPSYCSPMPYTVETNYYLPGASLTILLLIGILLIVLGILKLNKRDIA